MEGLGSPPSSPWTPLPLIPTWAALITAAVIKSRLVRLQIRGKSVFSLLVLCFMEPYYTHSVLCVAFFGPYLYIACLAYQKIIAFKCYIPKRRGHLHGSNK